MCSTGKNRTAMPIFGPLRRRTLQNHIDVGAHRRLHCLILGAAAKFLLLSQYCLLQPCLADSAQGPVENIAVDPDIIKVLNTSDRLWLYQQSYDNKEEDVYYDGVTLGLDLTKTCTHLLKVNMSDSDYYAMHKMQVDKQDLINKLHGRICRDETAPRMFVSDLLDNDTKPFGEMKLVYTDSGSYKCSVFIVTYWDDESNGTSVCEMYIREGSGNVTPTNSCLEYYNCFCNETYSQYTDDCKNSDIWPEREDNSEEKQHFP
ncbi:uncharacterized protein LOC125940061 [Dermacentor silvarum]|uniref:uncharacterized protein LOC125940061 n=1 Tax=Dermacentor silvarum TaxID=543639 RepID=UPI002101728D|nr:uncharacterized protein LOC125940061 [Dermacentor silvarum]